LIRISEPRVSETVPPQHPKSPGGVLKPSQNQGLILQKADGFCYTAPHGIALGYARVSTADQNRDLQVDELTAAGCDRIFIEHATGARARATAARQVIDHLRSGDTLVVGDSTAWRGRCAT
jgi:hypothetical protein